MSTKDFSIKNLQLALRYSSLGEMELSGTAAELEKFAKLLEDNEDVTGFNLINFSLDPHPYEGFLSTIKVISNSSRAGGLLNIQRQQQVLLIEGSAKNIQLFANDIFVVSSNARPASSGKLKYHIHIEYFPDYSYLAASSEALTITVENTLI